MFHKYWLQMNWEINGKYVWTYEINFIAFDLIYSRFFSLSLWDLIKSPVLKIISSWFLLNGIFRVQLLLFNGTMNKLFTKYCRNHLRNTQFFDLFDWREVRIIFEACSVKKKVSYEVSKQWKPLYRPISYFIHFEGYESHSTN